MDKNSKSRLRAVNRHLDKALDSLHRAQGELYPAHLADYRSGVAGSISALQGTLDRIGTALKAADTPEVDGRQVDLEDAIRQQQAEPEPAGQGEPTDDIPLDDSDLGDNVVETPRRRARA